MENDNRKEKEMNFGEALNSLKNGGKVARTGWRDAKKWIALQQGYPKGIPINKNTAEATGLTEGSVHRFSPYFIIYIGMLDTFSPWTAAHADLLAEDWENVLFT